MLESFAIILGIILVIVLSIPVLAIGLSFTIDVTKDMPRFKKWYVKKGLL